MPLQRPFRALSHVHPPSSTPAPPTLLYISQPCHPLSTPLAPTILLSPHRPALNRLLWNLFKYFDISPPLTSRAEMICDSWRWARSEQLPQTPCFLFFLPSFFGEGQIFPFQPPSPFYLSYLLLLLLSAEAGLERFLACFFLRFQSVIDKLGDIPIFVDIVCLLSFMCLLLSSHLLCDSRLTPCICSIEGNPPL